jgi:hypothetical protein
MLQASAGVAVSITEEPGDDHADVRRPDAGARERHRRRAPAGLGVRVERRLLSLARVAVPRRADVVERQRGPPGADADALLDPRLRGADVEALEERVRDLVLRVEVPEAVQEERHAVAPDTCSPPSTRMSAPLTHAASSVDRR